MRKDKNANQLELNFIERIKTEAYLRRIQRRFRIDDKVDINLYIRSFGDTHIICRGNYNGQREVSFPIQEFYEKFV